MSDVEQEDDEPLENPEPEADSTPEANAQTESEHEAEHSGEDIVNHSVDEQLPRDVDDVLANGNEHENLPESQSEASDVPGICHNSSLAEGDQNVVTCNDRSHNNSLAEGDQSDVSGTGICHNNSLAEGDQSDLSGTGICHNNSLAEGDQSDLSGTGICHNNSLAEGDQSDVSGTGICHKNSLAEGDQSDVSGTGICHNNSLAEGDQSDVSGTGICHNNSLAEGDQNEYRYGNVANNDGGRNVEINGDAVPVDVACEHHNEFAAEDEQYYENVGLDFTGAEWSLEPEENSQSYSRADGQCEGAEGADITEEVESEQSEYSGTEASHRTESSYQLTDFVPPAGSGAGSYDENAIERNESGSQRNDAYGASASSGELDEGDCSFQPEGVSVRNDSNSESVENEPTEADQELQLNSASCFVNDEQLSVPANGEVENDIPRAVINNSSIITEINSNSIDQGAMNNNGHLEKTVPEDELGALAPSSNSRTISVTKSYQPECDQSTMEVNQSESSLSHRDISNPNCGEGLQNACNAEEDLSETARRRDLENNLELKPGTNTNKHIIPENIEVPDEKVGEKNHEEMLNSAADNENTKACANMLDKSNSNCDKQTEKKTPVSLSDLTLTKDKGAIPKQRINTPVKKSEKYDASEKNVKTSNKDCLQSAAENTNANNTSRLQKTKTKANVDSEEELLSELDATLLGNETEPSSQDYSLNKCAIFSDKDTSNMKKSCEQCLKNNLKCSFGSGGSVQRRDNPNIPETREIKKQLHQAKQLLLDRECQISRLKEDLEEQFLRSETLLQERDSYMKDVECLKTQNSDDLYIPQIKELEYTIAQQQNEVRGFKDKLSSHDSAAKRAIATLQNEMKLRLDQVTKMYEEANKEKDSMVVKFAQAEHKNLECQHRTERAEAKLRDMEKERDAFLIKMRAIKEQRTKLGAEVETKNSELSQVTKELDKHREMVSSADVRVKWAQNKLKAELEGHKDTKVQLDKMNIKLKEAKEETQQIRQDCQRIIKTYQESEEVKSNSLDKELKQKESELLENQMQKTNFELAHVKTRRELEHLKVDLQDSQAQCHALTEKITGLEAGQEQSSTAMNKYTEIIQRQKKEIQELRERIEELVQFKSDFVRAQELIKNLDSEISELKISNKDLVAEMEACRRRETDKLELTEKLSRKNAELQSENTTLSNKVLNLTGELQATKMEYQDVDTKLRNISDSLATEQKLRQEETQSLTTKFAGKCKAVEDLTRKVEEEKDEIKILKRKQANNVKDLTRQLQQVRRKLESYEASTNGDKDTTSMGSRTSSNGSLNTVNIAEQTNTHVVQPASHHGQLINSSNRNPSPEQEYPMITEQVEVDKQVLIEKIVKLQRALARKNEKIEFMDDHISQLVDEIQKKNRIIQSYILKEETGTMTSDMREHAKADLSKKHSIMGSVYSSHSNDGSMTLDLSLEINRKLQAVLEDTLLKNMTLKESLDTLGQEIARLSQDNRKLQLHIQGKSRVRANPSTR